MRSIFQDMRYALRQLRRAPGFTATAVLTLALGLGASSTIFCLMDGLWLHPMRVPHPGQIVRIFGTTPQKQEGAFNYTEYQALAQRVNAFQGASAGLVAIGGRGSLMPRPDGTSSLLLTNVVSSNFFAVLGVHPLMGRVFTAQDAERLRTHPGVVLGYHCWQKEFASDPNIVGRQIALRHGKDHVSQVDVWGVLPSTFREIDPDSDRDLWMPAESWAAVRDAKELTSRDFRWFNLLGRLAPGATVRQANDQVATVAGTFAAADPSSNHGRGARAISDFSYRMSQAGTSGLVLFAIVGGVVLLAIVNVAHLLLARALVRAPEIALRLSLGARRWVVARQLLIENLMLAALGLTAGLGLAAALAAVLPHLLVREPAMLASYGSGVHFQLDTRVFFFASLLALVTMLLLSLVPLSQVARAALLPALGAGAATRTAGRTPMVRRAAVWLQIGISFALLVSTGALVRSFLNTRTQSIGLTRNQVLVAWTQGPDAPVRDTVLTNLRALSGVQSVAYGIRSPLMPSEGGIAAKVLLPSHPELHEPVEIKFNAVSSGFLDVTGTRVVLGRGITAADDAGGPVVVLINQSMAQKYWPGQNPIGQVVRLANGAVDARVVGVTENAPIIQIGEIPEPYLYVPFQQCESKLSNMGEIAFVLETRQNAMSMAQDVRQALIHVNPLLDPMMVTSLPELIRYSAGNYQMMAELVSALGLIGLALTVVGLYGFLAFRVTQRRREIGIRMALGASREATVSLVLLDTMRMAAIGLTIGVGLAFAAARFESAVLFGVRPLDALSLAVALVILAAAVAAAAWLPARRAASIEPMQALRTE
ncbi:MAG: ADOP family duplicated permease [Terracidiphilus sp.]|nr:ADOP family duplicated permease [Terracidiphilus sp.]